MTVASRTSMTVRCATCGNLGTHLNGPYCLHCRALLPPPGTPTRPLKGGKLPSQQEPVVPIAAAVIADARPAAPPPAAPQPAVQFASAPAAAPAPELAPTLSMPSSRAAIEQQLPRYGPPALQPHAQPYAPYLAPYAGYAPPGYAPPGYSPQATPPEIPSWLLPVRLVVFAAAILSYIAALRFAADGIDADQPLAIGFLVFATAALLGSIGLRIYARTLRRRIRRWRPAPATKAAPAARALAVPPSAAPQRRSIVGPAPALPRNPYASTALLYGVVSVGITIGAALLGYYAFGLLSLYSLYFGIRGVATASHLRGHTGLIPSILGLLLSAGALLLTALVATGIMPLMVSM